MSQFTLLLHEAATAFAELSPEEIQGIISRYTAWRREKAEEGKIVGGYKLADEGGRHLSRRGGEVRVVDGPYSEAKEIIGGLFIIEAADYEEAVEVCSTCPHLDFGWIELRQVDQV